MKKLILFSILLIALSGCARKQEAVPITQEVVPVIYQNKEVSEMDTPEKEETKRKLSVREEKTYQQALVDNYFELYTNDRVNVFFADLTHNGTDEMVVTIFDADYPQQFPSGHIDVYTVENGEAKRIMEQAVGSGHINEAGWYLCQIDGEDYMMVSMPYGNHGVANYAYSVFHMKSDGSRVSLRNGELTYIFDELNPDYNEREPETAAKIQAYETALQVELENVHTILIDSYQQIHESYSVQPVSTVWPEMANNAQKYYRIVQEEGEAPCTYEVQQCAYYAEENPYVTYLVQEYGFFGNSRNLAAVSVRESFSAPELVEIEYLKDSILPMLFEDIYVLFDREEETFIEMPQGRFLFAKDAAIWHYQDPMTVAGAEIKWDCACYNYRGEQLCKFAGDPLEEFVGYASWLWVVEDTVFFTVQREAALFGEDLYSDGYLHDIKTHKTEKILEYVHVDRIVDGNVIYQEKDSTEAKYYTIK